MHSGVSFVTRCVRLNFRNHRRNAVPISTHYPRLFGNLGVRFVGFPNSRRYVVCEGTTPTNHFKSSLRKQEFGVPSDRCLNQLIDEGGIVTATGKPGSVILFDCNTMHGSNGNITPYPRSNAFFVYNAISNQVVEPFCDQPPRPDYICSRQNIDPVMVEAEGDCR